MQWRFCLIKQKQDADDFAVLEVAAEVMPAKILVNNQKFYDIGKRI